MLASKSEGAQVVDSSIHQALCKSTADARGGDHLLPYNPTNRNTCQRTTDSDSELYSLQRHVMSPELFSVSAVVLLSLVLSLGPGAVRSHMGGCCNVQRGEGSSWCSVGGGRSVVKLQLNHTFPRAVAVTFTSTKFDVNMDVNKKTSHAPSSYLTMPTTLKGIPPCQTS